MPPADWALQRAAAMIAAMPLVLFAASLLLLCLRALGVRQGPSLGRRLAFALSLALATAATLAPMLFQPVTFLRGVSELAVEDGHGGYTLVANDLPGIEPVVAFMAWFAAYAMANALVRLPRRLRQFERLPAVTEAAVVARLHDWSGRLRIAPPRLLVERSEFTMDVGALAIDTLAPTIVLQDGTMHRLAADQRDAVLAHELGHLARHDARRGFAVTVAAGLVAVQASRWLTIGPAVALLVGMLLLLRNVCRQRSELAADHLGARLAGSFPMARALDTTCAANAQQSFGPWSHALLSHPHLQVRAARVRAAAIDDTASAIAVDTVLVRRCERARRIAVAASAASLVAAIWTGAEGHESWSIALALAPAAAMLGTLLALQRWRHLLYVRQLGWRPLRTAKWRLVWLGLAALCVWLVTAIAAATAVFAVAAFVALVLAIGWGWRERRASARLDERMRAHDLHGWLAAYHALPRRLRQRPDLWLSAVRLRWRRDGAAAAARELSALRSRWPHYHLATIDHISQLRATDPAAAMAVARTLHERFPDNPWTVGSLAATLRAAGSLDEAWHLAQRLARLPSVPGWADAIACRIAVARGDLAAARVAAARAGRAAPGDLVVLLAQAEFEVAAREPAAAATVARLQAIEGQTLVSYLRHDVAAVVQGLRDRGDPSAAATS